MSAASLIRAGQPAACRPWPRHVLSPANWTDMARALPHDPGLAFTALWADPTHVHALFQADELLLASVAVEAGLYAALSPARPAAALFERMIADLWGHQAANAIDVRPWLDHGTWPTLRPLSDRPVPNTAAAEQRPPEPPDMLQTPGSAIPCGPLPPTLAAPAYWRTTLSGPTVHRLEARLGWAHRGVLALMRGKFPAAAARFAARIDGAATVAHATAFARAVEAALDVQPPPAAIALRELMLVLERIAVGLHDLHATAAALGTGFAPAARARETLLQACATLSGHRLMMDAVRPGGVAIDPPPAALAALDSTLAAIPDLDRTWPPIGTTPIAGRMRLLTQTVATDIDAARTLLANVPAGTPLAILPATAGGEGLGLAQGPGGPVWHWVRLADGTITANFAAAPGWLQLPALEAAAIGAMPESLPAIAAAFALRPAGLDL